MTFQEFFTAVQNGGIYPLVLLLWWLERKERIKIHKRLDECLGKKDPKLRQQ